MSKWLLIDGFNLAYRCFHALPELTSSKGFPTGALHGWCKSLWKLIDQEKPDATLVFFDRPCSLVGTWVENALQAQVEIHIPGTGFYWLTWVEDAPGRFHMNATTTPEDAELVFVIS